MAVKSTGLLAPDNWAYEPAVKQYEYNPDTSIQLLDSAGYTDPDGQGPEPRFTIVYKTSQNKRANMVAEVIKSDLQRVGINVDILRYEWPTFYSDIKKSNFQMFSLTWVGVEDPDIYYQTDQALAGQADRIEAQRRELQSQADAQRDPDEARAALLRLVDDLPLVLAERPPATIAAQLHHAGIRVLAEDGEFVIGLAL